MCVSRKRKAPGSHKRRVLLLCAQSLLGEGLSVILGGLSDVELVGPLRWDDPRLSCQQQDLPATIDVVLIAAEEDKTPALITLTAQLLDLYPDAPVVRVGLKQGSIRLYTSRTLPARAADLVEAIRDMPIALHPDRARRVRTPNPSQVHGVEVAEKEIPATGRTARRRSLAQGE